MSPREVSGQAKVRLVWNKRHRADDDDAPVCLKREVVSVVLVVGPKSRSLLSVAAEGAVELAVGSVTGEPEVRITPRLGRCDDAGEDDPTVRLDRERAGFVETAVEVRSLPSVVAKRRVEPSASL